MTIKDNKSGALSRALTDPAFPASSQPVHDGILRKYPTVDANGDGVISIGEAASWTGTAISFDGRTDAEFADTTITGVEHFTNLQVLRFYKSNISGEIPEGITNMTQLRDINFGENKLTGQLPENIGNLVNIKTFYVQGNQLTGPVPASVGYMASLEKFVIGRNQMSGELPESLYTIATLTAFSADANPGLSGNPALGFKNHPSLVQLTIDGTNLIQAKPESSILTNFRGDDLAANLLSADQTGPKPDLTQSEIDRAQESANWISDPLEKQAWQDNIDAAQTMLDVTTSVVELLNDTKTDIKDGVVQSTIDDTQTLINTLVNGQFKTEVQAELDMAQHFLSIRNDATTKTDALFTTDGTNITPSVDQNQVNDAQAAIDVLVEGTFKTALQNKLNVAQNLLDKQVAAQNAVNNLFDSNGSGKIKTNITQANINNAYSLVNALADGPIKQGLLTKLADAQSQFDAIQTLTKPLVVSSSKSVIKSGVNTGDATNNTAYVYLLASSIALLALLATKKRANK